MRCWPTGSPMDWAGWDKVKWKILVSGETDSLEVRVALFHVLDWRKMGRLGLLRAGSEVEEDSRAARAEGVRVPMW